MDWFEVISENFMVGGGSPLYHLDALRAHYPVVNHGVSLSLGGGRDAEHLDRLVALTRRIDPPWLSDHLCWVGDAHRRSFDLLPVPYTDAVRDRIVDRIREVQDRTGKLFAVENTSSYLSYRASVVPEQDFLAEVVTRADCALLLDVNNVFVSSVNHGFDPERFLDGLPLDRVVQVHLAGHKTLPGYRLDTHDRPVCDEVWALYRRLIGVIGRVSTLIEWDDDIPSFARLQEEAARARAARDAAAPVRVDPTPPARVEAHVELPASWQSTMIGWIQGASEPDPTWFAGGPGLGPADQIAVYQDQFRLRMASAMDENLPGLSALLEGAAVEVWRDYLRDHPPTGWTLDRIADAMPGWLAARGAPAAQVELARVDLAVNHGFVAAQLPLPGPRDLNEHVRLTLQPHVQVVRLTTDVHAWRSVALGFERSDLPPIRARACVIVVYRSAARTMRHLEVDDVWATLLESFGPSSTIGDALERAVALGVDPGALLACISDVLAETTALGWLGVCTAPAPQSADGTI
jgi:uncharacterized protein (UPF0276 family)